MPGTIFIAFGLLFAIIGIILLMVGVRQKSDMKDCREVIARIVDFEVRRHTRHSYASHPVYEYTDFGEIKRYTSFVGLKGISESVGTEVTLYISKRGKIYEKRTSAVLLILGIGFTAFGVVFTVVGIIVKCMLSL